jgi:hypothetical protein
MGIISKSVSEIDQRDRRSSPRESVLRRGKVTFGATVYDVIVLDQSEGGVRAKSAIPITLPETFVFHVGPDMSFTARLRWSRDTEFGVAIIAPRAASDLTSRRLLDVYELMRARNFAGAYARLRESDHQADIALRALLGRAETANAELEEELRRRIWRG